MVVVAEVAVVVTVVGWFVSPHITKLMEVARSCTSSKYNLPRDIKKKLLKLEQDLGDIKVFLDPASMRGSVNDPTWLQRLWRLKDAIHESEEILDLFESHILEAEAAKNLKKHRCSSSSSRKSKYAWWIGRGRGSGTTNAGSSLDQLKKVLKNLGELRERARELHEDPSTRSAVLCPMLRTAMGAKPVRDKKLFFGYGKEYEQLLSMLRDGNKDKKVIAILGHGGMGKTELARQAYREVAGEFDRLIWVPAYDKNTEFDLLAEIWKSAVGEKSVDEMNISSLQNKLKEHLTSSKCLLVLDDVWCNEEAINRNQRKDALRCFTDFVGAGSRIVLTTRARICSATLSPDEPIVLNGIKPEEIMLLVNDAAELRTDGDATGAGDRRIQELLKTQVLKFKGSPSAAIEIGEELKVKARTASAERRNILNNIEGHIAGVFKGHLFSYHHLPPHLQRCFAFCSIFPDHCRFEPEKLTKMWMALGFVEEKVGNGVSSMEDVARGYFDDLVDRSMFQLEEESKGGGGGKQTRYVIHEQIHWMIREASARNCTTISGRHCAAKTRIPATVRHLSVTSGYLGQLNEYSIGLGNLRTLIVLKDDDDGIHPKPSMSAIDKDILQQFKGVRVLDLTETGITEFPASVGKLKHVRYLGLPGTISDNLGDQVNRLLFLQTLSVGEGDDRYHKERKRQCITNISGIGRLVKLRESIVFEVSKGSEKEGHSVSELAGMKSLRKTLSITGLDAVASKEEAKQARLENKCSVKVLKLQWGAQNAWQLAAGAAADTAVAVLEGLKPHRSLDELRITRYPGETSPSWLLPTVSGPEKLDKLTRLYLRNCTKLQALPAVGRLPCLELLDAKGLPAVASIDGGFCGGGGVFPKLKKIVLDDMPKLVAWDDMPKQALPLLREVSVADCPLLSSLSGLGRCASGIHLRVERCPSITPETLPATFSTGDSTYKFH